MKKQRAKPAPIGDRLLTLREAAEEEEAMRREARVGLAPDAHRPESL